MEFLLSLSFIFILVIFIILLNLKSFIKSETDILKFQLDELKKQLASGTIAVTKKQAENKEVKEKQIETEPEIKKETEPVIEKEKSLESSIKEEVISTTPEKEKIKKSYNKPIQKAFKSKKKTNFEKFIGENLMNKIGILILIIAVGLGIKYAIGEGWINPVGRIVLSLLTGTILVALAYKLRKNYSAFSSVLIGGGIAVYYFSIAFGYQMYEIFNQVQAFILMVAITGFAVGLSLAFNRKELAVLAIIGGFATPIMVSSGAGNYKVLFTYIMILDIGMLILAYYKKWNLVNIVSYVSTVILFSLWMIKTYRAETTLPYIGTLLFASGFYIIFFLMNIVNNIKENERFTAIDFIILLSNSFFYYAAGLFLLHKYAPDFQGIFTILLAVINLLFAYPLYKRSTIDRNLVLLLIGLVLTFVSLTGPVQLEGNFITLFWAIETVLLLWLSQKTGIQLLKTSSLIVVSLMMISLIIDWDKYYNSYSETPMPLIINHAFITGIVSIAGLLAAIKLLSKETTDNFLGKFNLKAFHNYLIVLLIISGYFAKSAVF